MGRDNCSRAMWKTISLSNVDVDKYIFQKNVCSSGSVAGFILQRWAFKNQLEKSGINVTIRREMGRDIHGACGQLRRSYLMS